MYTTPSLTKRVARHLRLTRSGFRSVAEDNGPSFLILFINSICNQTCEHCFYWRNLNRKDDLSFDELKKLSDDLGQVENLNLSGGEPFLRTDFAEVCRLFITNNKVKQIYVPTNGSFADRTEKAVRGVLEDKSLDLFAVEFSLDGMPEYHDTFRGMKNAFERSMQTYDALARLQREDPRLRLHAISTVTGSNIDEITRLTTHLYERCPQMDHHNLAIIRGDRKNPTLHGPGLAAYRDLYNHIKKLWEPREKDRYGSIVEPMLQWAKTRTAEEKRQVVPCAAGRLSAVVYSNGDVSLCESHAPLANLREKSFREIWTSQEARTLRDSIAAKECYCTNEVFLWSSIVYQPLPLISVMAQSKPWKKPEKLAAPPSNPPTAGSHPQLTVIK